MLVELEVMLHAPAEYAPTEGGHSFARPDRVQVTLVCIDLRGRSKIVTPSDRGRGVRGLGTGLILRALVDNLAVVRV